MIRGKAEAVNHKPVFYVIFAVTLAAFCITGLFLLESHRQRGLAEDYYKAVRDSAASAEEQTGSVPLLPAASPAAVGGKALKELRGKYPDLVAWIRIPGTEVDYPVVQGEDNAYYLDHLPDGSANQVGSIFADCRCSSESPHLILYGHNLRGGGMFGSLRRYRGRAYYEEHPSLTLYTEIGQWDCPIFSVHVVSAADENAYAVSFESEDAFDAFVGQLCQAALYETDFCPEPGSGAGTGMRVVTLSTCTGDSRERLVVHAALPESEEDGSAAIPGTVFVID